MKRRSLLQGLAILPAVPALAPAQTSATPSPLPKLELSSAEAVAEPANHFFTADEMSALHKLAELILPGGGGNPSAIDAGAPEFLDFLIGHSPAAPQTLYRQGLDRLNRDAQAQFHAPFAKLTDEQAAVLLKPLQTPSPYDGPSDAFARFLHTLRIDLLTATRNSREWAQAPTRGRSSTGLGMYWYPLD